MARRFSNKLIAKQVTAITKPGKHSDGDGLYLLEAQWQPVLGAPPDWWWPAPGNGLGTPGAVSLAARANWRGMRRQRLLKDAILSQSGSRRGQNRKSRLRSFCPGRASKRFSGRARRLNGSRSIHERPE